MDGIFGVGIGEIIVVILAMFIIGGPENTAKWAREAGRWARKAREAWSDVVADMEKELGPEGKELMNVTREITQGAREVRSMRSPKRLIGETMRMVEESVDLKEPKTPSPDQIPPVRSANGAGASASTGDQDASDTPTSQDAPGTPPDSTPGSKTYRAWLPPGEGGA